MRVLRRRVPFVLGWRNVTIIGLALGVFSVTVTLLLEPFGTDRYQASWRLLRLSGYAICHVVPIVALHGLDRVVYRRRRGRWVVGNEIISRSLMLLAVTTASWLYNITFINSIDPSWGGWMDYQLNFALPGIPVMLPLVLLLVHLLATRFPEDPPRLGRQVEIRGRGQGERVVVPLEDFVFAEAQQNYAAIFVRAKDSIEEHFFRVPLSDLEQQIPGSIRIHRSFLVGPETVRRVVGNARRREAVLHDVDRRLPVSPSLDTERALGEPD